MPWIHLHEHSLNGCVHNTIHVSLFRVSNDVYVSMLSCKFFNDCLWFHTSTLKNFTPHSSLAFTLWGASVTQRHCPCTPRSSILEDIYSELYMLFHHEEHAFTSLFIYRTFPSYIISQESSFKLSFQTGISAQFLPCTDLQSLKPGLAPYSTSEPFFTRADPILASF